MIDLIREYRELGRQYDALKEQMDATDERKRELQKLIVAYVPPKQLVEYAVIGDTLVTITRTVDSCYLAFNKFLGVFPDEPRDRQASC